MRRVRRLARRRAWVFPLAVLASAVLVSGCSFSVLLQASGTVAFLVSVLLGLAACGGSSGSDGDTFVDGPALEIDLTTLVSPNGTIIEGESTDDGAGTSVSGGFDINGGGDDIIIGAPGVTVNSNSESGRAYVLYGGSALGDSVSLADVGSAVDGFTFEHDSSTGISGARIGETVVGAGDFDGNNPTYDDVIIGAPRYSGTYGSAFVMDGSNAPAPGGALYQASAGLSYIHYSQEANTAGKAIGDVAAALGDWDGDNQPDLAFSARNGCTSTDEVFIVPGQSVPLDVDSAAVKVSAGAQDLFGDALAGVGDFNGDNFDDLLIGARQTGVGGQAWVVLGTSSVAGSFGGTGTINASSLNGSNGFVIHGEASGDRAGEAVAGAGDVKRRRLRRPAGWRPRRQRRHGTGVHRVRHLAAGHGIQQRIAAFQPGQPRLHDRP